MKTIVITGPSGSGKTFLANRLTDDLDNAFLIKTDSYYRDNLFIKFLSIFMGDIYDRFESFKSKEIQQSIESIYNNEKEIKLYKYEFKSRKSSQTLINNKENNTKYLIIEGIFSHRINLNYKNSINILCKQRKDICYKRRLSRDIKERGRNSPEVKKKFDKSWILFFKDLHKYIYNYQVILTNTEDKLSYLDLINLIKKKTEVNN